MRRFIHLGSMAFLAFYALYGCAVVAAPVVTEVVTRAYEERTAEQQITDAKIHTRILNFFLNKGGDPVELNTDVWQRRVMLTGTMTDSRLRDYMANRIREDGRVRAFYNHVRIIPKMAEEPKGEKEESPEEKAVRRRQEDEDLAQRASDGWINTKIKAQLITAGGVKSVNYRWQSVQNRVYVIGLARTSLEKDRVLQIIRETKGVKDVKDYIEVLRGN